MPPDAGEKQNGTQSISVDDRRHAFLSARPSFSGTIPWIATNTSTGVKAGPVWAEPCHEQH